MNVRHTQSDKENMMATKHTYKVLSVVGEETPHGNAALEQLEHFVNEHISEGWMPIGGVAVSAVIGPKTVGSTKDNWFVRVAQAMVLGSEE